MTLPDLKQVMETSAYAAGEAIMEIYHNADSEVEYKADNSPVTIADKKAEDIITKALQEHYPNVPIIAEEAASAGNIPNITNSDFFLVDPLDGTKEFIKKRSDFTVNIALIENGIPTAGIVYAPMRKETWICCEGKAEKITNNQTTPISVRNTNSPEIAVVSRSHCSTETEDYLKNFEIKERTSAGSSLKFCLVAEGNADIYPRFGRTMEWDTAAGDAILRAAGGRVVLEDGKTPLPYGKRNQAHDSDFANPFFIADNQAH